MGKALNAAGKLIDTPRVSDVVRAAGKVRGDDNRRQIAWAERKALAHRAVIATDYLALQDRRPMTGAEKSYREALRAIIRAEPNGDVPKLPAL